MKSCARCGNDFAPNSNRQKFCKDCSYAKHLQDKRARMDSKRQKEGGTFGANPIRNKDNTINFTVEHAAIIKEMKRLGLRQQHD